MPVAIAAPNDAAADAAAEVVSEGGNAVDAALVGILVAALTEPGICSVAGGGFATVAREGELVVLDGYAEMPGRGLAQERFGQGTWPVEMAYGGGTTTLVGPGTVATPGGLAAIATLSESFGNAPWRRLLEPVADVARRGFPLSAASDAYLVHSADPVFGWDPASRAILFDGDRRRVAGERIVIPDLADLLDALAEEGVGLLYRGEAGALIAEHVLDGGGVLTRADLEAYTPVWREPLSARLAGRTLATNPGPAVGGAALVAILELTAAHLDGAGFTEAGAGRFAEAQAAVFSHRREVWDLTSTPDVADLVAAARRGDLAGLTRSPSTVHVSTAGSDGTACAITFSAGYGSGVIAPGTGLWLNNSLGELELTRGGLHAATPATRLVSNMAPTIALGGDDLLAVGSPGADRITSAIATTLLAHLVVGLDLDTSVSHPRLHVEVGEDGDRVALEPGMPYAGPLPTRPFEDLHMFFGGVGAAWASPEQAHAVADPRRTGSTRIAG